MSFSKPLSPLNNLFTCNLLWTGFGEYILSIKTMRNYLTFKGEYLAS